jgi:pimeloyl-ACP methyl ester carboxylesterase
LDWVIRSALVVLKIGMLFVPQQKYIHKLEAIPTEETKNISTDLRGWEYCSLPSPDSSFVHHYYRLPSKKTDAPVFLFFHGLNLDGRTFLNLKSLANEWELIAYDLPDKTARYQGQFTDFTDMIEEFVRLKKIRDCTVCGVSFGGGLALHLTAEHPEFGVKNLALISTGIVGGTPADQKRNHKMADWIGNQPDYKIFWLMEKLHRQSERSFAKDTVSGIKEILRVKHPTFYRQVALSMEGFNAATLAQKVTCPVLVLFGDKDNMFTTKQVDAIKENIPQAQIVTIHNGTHSMVYTMGDTIAAKIRSFTSANPPGRSAVESRRIPAAGVP